MITKVGSLVAYISGKYAKRNASTGNVQIAMTDIEYDAQLEKIPFGPPRTKAIRAMIDAKIVPKQKIPTTDSRLSAISPLFPLHPNQASADAEVDINEIDDSDNVRLPEEGLIIGRAKEHWCRVSNKRPLVRAVLNSRDNVMAFVPTKYAKHQRDSGEVQIPPYQVDFGKEFSALPPWDISGTIKKRLMKKRELRETSGQKLQIGKETCVLEQNEE